MDSVKLDFHHAHVYVTLIWFLIIGVIETMSTSTCTGSNERFVDGTCYRFYSHPATWFEAKLLCEGQGDILASVKSLYQIKEILKNQNLKTEAWIGATDHVIEGNYLWIQNNQLANNDLRPLWDPREPNNENHNSREDEDCVSVYANSKVNDAPCSFKFPYICMDTMKLTGLYSLQINCPDGKFGYKCRYMCQCAVNIACDKITGLCFSGLCKVGYWGPGCQLDDKCFYNQQPKKYMGMLSSTKSNLTCQHWNTNYPYKQQFTVSEFVDRRLPDNYCRHADEKMPWCYTTSSKVRWEFCPVESCACPLGRYDIYCNKDCHCKNSNEQCDEESGECKSGCAMGWTGKDCQTVFPCEPNKYGWECEKNCYCENPSHCERFLGATSHCVSSKPMIVHFENNLVLPGQASTFTCTVQANPPPNDDEIQMFGPQGKNIISLSSRILETSTLRRTKIFYVTSVGENEQYTCSVQSELGSNNLTLVADFLVETMSTSTCKGSNERFVDGTCYRFYSRPASWFDAKLLCEGQDDILASVTSLYQIKEILKNQSLQTEAWIGATDYVIEGNYLWIQNNQLANNDLKSLWYQREPNNENHNSREDEDCVGLYANCTVNDAPCSFKSPYICMDTMKLTGLYSLQMNCPDGKFGYKCRYMCQCAINIPCDKITGLCFSGLCKVGYWGPGCQLDDKCFYNQQPKKYMGMLSSTKSNLTCQHWNTNYPHKQQFTVSEFVDRRLPDNYCRHADEDMPWCYTTSSKVRWEFCPVESCACPLGRYDIYCNKDCHCKNSNEQCDEESGECKSGCAMGWTGKDCQTVFPCEPNKYGWECEKNCYCENPSHCERFLGATSHCVSSKPMIVHFENNLVLPGQASTFTCTVQANPPPNDDEIQMFGPQGKNIISLSSRILETSTLRRTKIFYVMSVGENEQYTCSVQSELGSKNLTLVADLLGGPPECPVNVTVLKVAKDHVSLSWEPGKENELPQTYKILAHNISVFMNRFLESASVGTVHTNNYTRVIYTVGSLSELTQYTFSVEVENKFGTRKCTDNFIQVTTSSGLQKLSFPSWLIFLLIFIPIVLAAGIPGFIFYKRKANRSKALRMNTFSAFIEKSDHHSIYHTVQEAAAATIRDTDDERDYDLIIEEPDLEDFKSPQFEREGIRPLLPPRSSEKNKSGTKISDVSVYDLCGAHEIDQPVMTIADSTSQYIISIKEEDNDIKENDFVLLSEDKGNNNSLHKPFRNQNNNQESAGLNRYSKTFIEFKIKRNENSSPLIAQKENQYSGHDREFKTEDEESVKTLKATDANTHEPHNEDTGQEQESKTLDNSTKTLKENNTSQANDKDIDCTKNENSYSLTRDLVDTEAYQGCYSSPLMRSDVHFYASLSCVDSRRNSTLKEKERNSFDEKMAEHTNDLTDKPNTACHLNREIDEIETTKESYVDLTDQAYNADNSSYIPSMLSNFVHDIGCAMRKDDSNQSKDDPFLKGRTNGLAGDIISSNNTKVEDNEYITALDSETYPMTFDRDEIGTALDNKENLYLQFDGSECDDGGQMKPGCENKEEYMTWDGGDVSCDEDVPNNTKPAFASSSREVVLDENSRKAKPAANQCVDNFKFVNSEKQEDVLVYWTPDGTKKRTFDVAKKQLSDEYSEPYDYLKNY